MAVASQGDWTVSAPKWAAVVVLGAASVAGVAWSMGREGEGWRGRGVAAASTAVVKPATVPVGATAAVVPEQAKVDSSPAAASTMTSAAAPEVKPVEHQKGSIRKAININTADAAELELLPGIGPALAKRIIDFRAAKGAFKRVEDLDAVKGIGPKILERVRGLVVVE